MSQQSAKIQPEQTKLNHMDNGNDSDEDDDVERLKSSAAADDGGGDDGRRTWSNKVSVSNRYISPFL